MDLAYSKYILTPIKKLNALDESHIREGVYLKIDNHFYLDYFPWPEFGDFTVDSMLNSIKQNGLPPFLENLLLVEKSKNNLPHLEFLNHHFNNLEGDVVKLKVINLKESVEDIKISKAKKIRLDFNGRYKLNEVKSFWFSLDAKDQARIEYIEDACSIENWEILRNLKIPLASDRLKRMADFIIYKPNIEYLENAKHVIFSSYMGSDLGRYHCYLSLLENGDLDLVHGINTPEIFKEQHHLFDQSGLKTKIKQDVVDLIYKELEQKEWILL